MALTKPYSHLFKHLTTKACLKMDAFLKAKNPYRDLGYE